MSNLRRLWSFIVHKILVPLLWRRGRKRPEWSQVHSPRLPEERQRHDMLDATLYMMEAFKQPNDSKVEK